jgi:hypothetical protein
MCRNINRLELLACASEQLWVQLSHGVRAHPRVFRHGFRRTATLVHFRLRKIMAQELRSEVSAE